MFHVALGFRAGIKKTISFALRDGRLATIAWRRLPLRNREHFFHARRSFYEVQSSASQPVCSARYLSTSSRQLSEEGDLVYTGNLARAVLGAKFFCYTISAFSLCMTPYILLKTNVDIMEPGAAFFIGFFTFIMPICLHLNTKGYVVRLYHNPATDIYTAVTYNVLPTEKKTVFHQSDVKIPEGKQMFTNFIAGQKPLMVSPDCFPIPHDYNHLMGYDKPFSFHKNKAHKT